MDKKAQHKIEEILKSLPAQSAPSSFTTNVMNDLQGLTQEEWVKDERLGALLKTSVIESPSNNFVNKVMDKIEASAMDVYQPLISKRMWILITVAFVALIGYVLFGKSTSQVPGFMTKATPLLERTQSIFEASQSSLQSFIQGFEISYLLAMSMLVLSVLIFVDFITKERQYA